MRSTEWAIWQTEERRAELPLIGSLRQWCANLAAHWDEAVADAGPFGRLRGGPGPSGGACVGGSGIDPECDVQVPIDGGMLYTMGERRPVEADDGQLPCRRQS